MLAPGPSAAELAVVLDACERVLGARPSSVTPDAIGALGHAEWTRFPDWEAMTELAIALRSNLFASGLFGPLLVVTEATFCRGAGVLSCAADGLGELIQGHFAQHGEAFFDGDVIIVERDGCRIWVFHHEGAYATFVR